MSSSKDLNIVNVKVSIPVTVLLSKNHSLTIAEEEKSIW